MKFSVLFAGLGLALAVAGGGGAANVNSAARVCPGSPIGTGSCHRLFRDDVVGNPQRTPAPGAKILLVEASSNSFTNLLAAEDYAKTHAQYVSNSWGGSEFSGESSYDSHFVESGVSFFVSSGDSGLPAQYPSASPKVISVGGTTLHFSGGNFTSETGWSSGGGGCSSYETATSAQSAFSGYSQVGCAGKRATPDVSLDADPASGVSVYDST